MVRLDFIYDYDLDSKGMFAFLRMKQPIGRNPAYPGPTQTVKIFASSVGQGFPESVICPREQLDFKTRNQAFSYIGIELLGGKRLVPSCYTLRNCIGDMSPGDSKSESGISLLNWQFEASSDMVSWIILDKRVHWPEGEMLRSPPSLKV